jgi:hypothetical protein
MSGTAFSAGQMSELQTMVPPAVVVALPKVAKRFVA